jgi:hypothetical protein
VTFWRDDFPALLLDFGHVVEDALGTQVRGILAEQDLVQSTDGGDVIVRETVLTVPSAALPDAEQGDTLRTWLADTPQRPVSWEIRRVLVRQDGTPTRFVVVAS